MKFARLVLVLSAVPFACIGAAFLLFPAEMSSLVGVSFSGATADADIRAVYGGLQLGCAVVLLLAAANPARHRFGLLIQMILYGGLAASRFVAYAIAGLPSPLGLSLHVAELLGFATGLLAWQRLARGSERAAA